MLRQRKTWGKRKGQWKQGSGGVIKEKSQLTVRILERGVTPSVLKVSIFTKMNIQSFTV